jgi:RNA polymerase sigma-70 factor, ECF subfamily
MNNAEHAPLLQVNTVDRAMARHDDIVRAARSGSSRAFAELHAIYSRRLYKAILAITKNPNDAEDALQETFFRAYRAIHAFEGRSSVYSWLSRIAVNSALMMLRRRRSHPEILFDPQPDALTDIICFEPRDSAPDPEQEYYSRQRLAMLTREVGKLSVTLQEPIRMQMAGASSLREISQALNISEAAVKARLHRARLRLSGAGGGKTQAGGCPGRRSVTANRRFLPCSATLLDSPSCNETR